MVGLAAFSSTALVRVELVCSPYVTEGPPHLFHDLHVFERRLERLGGCVHGLDCRMTGSLGCGTCLLTSGPRRFSGFPQTLTLFTKCLELLTMEVAHLPRFFCEPSELLRLNPAGLGGSAVFFGELAVVLGILTFILSPLAHALCLLPVLFWREVIVRHVVPLPGRPPRVDQSCRTIERRELLTLSTPLYSINPSFLNLFMKKFTRERVAPIISASVSCEILGNVRCGLVWP
jgi:hypothetical protein